ncbi:hypothetical protein BJV82DRAFT_628471 [Fennellomyces sp. T-0311]|nr:hypothetical protein BJV82DRAFT_628471 [Fennellomyces sp. T-0311]
MSNQPEKKTVWIPLESNPEVWNKIIHENGVSNEWSFIDVYGLDPELLSLVPQPVASIIFLYPFTEVARRIRSEEEARLTENKQEISPNVLFYKQTIGNACGMMAIIHSLANNKALVGPGLFHDIIQETEKLSSPYDRGKFLEYNEKLASVHGAGASSGQTTPPALGVAPGYAFICFTEVDGELYELAGGKQFPIHHGKCDGLLESTARVMRKFMDVDPGHTQYSVIALAKSAN